MHMKVFLTLGKSDSGELVSIESQVSGRTGLSCPFCAVKLIAVKGPIIEHHFRHDGPTCNESLTKLPEIPGWDHFHLSVPESLVTELQTNATGSTSYWGQKSRELLEYGLIIRDNFSGNWVLTEAALVITGQLSLPKFSEWFRCILKRRIEEKKHFVDIGQLHPVHLEIEAWRQQQILTATLYLFQLELADGSTIHKIGRTRRDPEERLVEVAADMKIAHNQPVKASLQKSIGNAGYIEKYALWKYKSSKYEVDRYQEYLRLDAAKVRHLKTELTRLSNSKSPFDKAEQFIASGRWRYEQKRLESVRHGIAKTIQEGSKFGRPQGSTKVGKREWLEQHNDIIVCLTEGHSLATAARRTGKSVSTVKRVKNQLR